MAAAGADAMRKAHAAAIGACGQIFWFFRMMRTPRIFLGVGCAVTWDCHGNELLKVILDR